MHALPPTVFLVFLELAVGGFLVQLWADWERLLSRGFIVSSTLILWTFAALGLWVRLAFPLAGGDNAWRGVETASTAAFTVLLLVYSLQWWARVERGRRLVASLAAVLGVVALLAASLVHAAALGPLTALVSLALGAASLGAAMVAMVLGHWYLVTPALSTRPLMGMTAVFLVAAALQGVLLPLQLLLGGDAAGGGTAALFGPYLVAFGLRVLVGILIPVVLAAMTWQTCRLRAMMSATGLLYIAVSCVLAGEIAAKTLYFLTGVPT